MELDELVRIHGVRGSNMMWLLGAGASVSARAPTATQMTEELKRLFYVSKGNRLPDTSAVTEPGVRQRIQDFVQGQGLPPAGHPSEYSDVIEAVYARPDDRRRYLQERLKDARPGYANLCFAALIAAGRIGLVWTTNFDQVVERACEHFGVSSDVLVITPETADAGVRAVTDGRIPLYVKMHGDYQYERLKNTATELQQQDNRLRQALVAAGQRHGLIVAGFSGRDASVLESLAQVLDGVTPYPHGLHWVHRTSDPPPPAVNRLLEQARGAGVDVHTVAAETFGELTSRLVEITSLPQAIRRMLDPHRPDEPDTSFVLPGTASDGDLVRLNALEVVAYPNVVRRLDCSIGGQAEVRKAVAEAPTRIVAVRTRNGVLAFGADDDVRAVFDPYGIKGWAQTLLQDDRLAVPQSMEQALLYEALVGAVLRATPLVPVPGTRSDNRKLMVDATRLDSALLEPLKSAVERAADAEQRRFGRALLGGTALAGTVPGTNLAWAESLSIRLDHRFDRLWLLLSPSVWVERDQLDQGEKDARPRRHRKRDLDDHSPRGRFLKSRIDHRYNDIADALLTAWVAVLVPGSNTELLLYGLDGKPGIDAAFRLAARTAYTRTETAQEVRRAG